MSPDLIESSGTTMDKKLFLFERAFSFAYPLTACYNFVKMKSNEPKG